MLHIYCGDGKGKTTAAMGLALRCAGRGGEVVIAQFLKGADSGERYALAQLPGVHLLEVPEKAVFSFRMTPQQRREAAVRFLSTLQECQRLVQEQSIALLVLDEACGAVNTGLLPLNGLLSLLECVPEGTEVVLTGRNPAPELLERGDYITEMCCQRHPYERGIRARPGIEY